MGAPVDAKVQVGEDISLALDAELRRHVGVAENQRAEPANGVFQGSAQNQIGIIELEFDGLSNSTITPNEGKLNGKGARPQMPASPSPPI